MGADKRANRQSDGLGIVERRQEFVRKQEDEEEAASNMPAHPHARTHRAIKRPFWCDCMSPARDTCCNHPYPCACAGIL